MINETLITELKAFIRENYQLRSGILPAIGSLIGTKVKQFKPAFKPSRLGPVADELDAFIKKERNIETFSALLERLRLERQLTPSALYKGAWVDKKLYSKIMGERNYHPSKNTVLAFGVALGLDREAMDLLLKSAGYQLSNSLIFDVVIMFCLVKRVNNLHDVNALLLVAGQKVLCRE
jgi:hypothetical protein